MTQRIITIPNGKRVPLGAYVKTWKQLKIMDPDDEVNGWEWFSVKVRDVLNDMSDAAERRLNSGIPCTMRGM